MRHGNIRSRLGREAAHRTATLRSLVAALINKEHIVTTYTKAMMARRLAEKVITIAKKDTLAAKRLVHRILPDKDSIRILFSEIAPRFKNRPGGYTRVIKLKNRPGDGAMKAVLELVEKKPKEIKPKKEKPAKGGSASGGKEKAVKTEEKPKEAVKKEAPKAEKPEIKERPKEVIKEKPAERPVEKPKEEKAAPKEKQAPQREGFLSKLFGKKKDQK